MRCKLKFFFVISYIANSFHYLLSCYYFLEYIMCKKNIYVEQKNTKIKRKVDPKLFCYSLVFHYPIQPPAETSPPKLHSSYFDCIV